MRAIWVLIVAGWLVAPASAEVPNELRGTWVWQVEGRNLLILELGTGTGGAAGSIQRPTTFMITPSADRIGVSRITLPTYRAPVFDSGVGEQGHTFRYAAPDEARTFAVRAAGPDALDFSLAANAPGVPRVRLVRAAPNATVSTDWPEGATYFVRLPAPASNAEIAKLFQEDQADRRVDPKSIDWKVVAPRDEARRTRVRELLDAGALRTGDDLFYAAFIFQHGAGPKDFLVAHTLANAAVAMGRLDATWIGAATLDRYLQSVGQAQIYGTQFSMGSDGKLSQSAMDATLIPDSVRQVLGVPTLDQQLKQMTEFVNRPVRDSGSPP